MVVWALGEFIRFRIASDYMCSSRSQILDILGGSINFSLAPFLVLSSFTLSLVLLLPPGSLCLLLSKSGPGGAHCQCAIRIKSISEDILILDRGSIRSSPRFGLSTHYRLIDY